MLPIFNLLGITETKLGDMPQANADYERAIALNPAFPAARKNLAVNLLAASRYAEAEEQLNAALKLDANDRFLHAYLASLYLATHRDQMAVAQIDAAQPLIDNDPAPLPAMAMACLCARHDMLKVLTSFGREKRRQPSIRAKEYELARPMTENRMYPEAVELFRAIVKVRAGELGFAGRSSAGAR